LWPNEETARVLAAAELEAKPQPTTVADQPQSNDEERYAEAPMGDLLKQLDALARELVAQADVNDGASANAEPSAACDQGQRNPPFPEPTVGLPKSPETAASSPLSHDRFVIPQQRQSGLSQDDLDLALSELRSSMGMVDERGRKSRLSAMFWFCAVVGVAALAASMVVLLSARPVVEKAKPAAPLIATDRNNDSSQATAEVTREPNQTDKVEEPVLPPASMPVTSPAAPSPPLQAASIQADASPAPPSQSPQATSVELNAAPVSAPQSSPPPMPVVEAGAAPSPEPPSQAASIQADASPVAAPPLPPPQAPSVEINAAPVSASQSSPPPVPGVEAGASPSPEPPSPPTQAASIQPDASPVAAPPSPSPQMTSVDANAAPTSAPQSSPPPMPVVEAGASPSPEPPSPPSTQAASIQDDASPVAAPPSPSPQAPSVEVNAAPASASQSSPPPLPSVEAGAAPSPEPPSPPTQAANTFSGSQSSPPQVTSVEIEQGAISGLQSPRAHGASTIVQLNDGEITALINHAKDFLKNGDFASARLLLRRAAEIGSADAALMLGETFDPLVMHERGAIGMAPDIAQATQWYEKAAKLGSDVATQRLAKLVQTGH
jgi:hypothetical protein